MPYKANFLQIFAAAKESLVLIRISMVPGLAVLFYRSPLNMIARERYSFHIQINLLFSIRRVNQNIKKIFQKVLKKMFLSFGR